MEKNYIMDNSTDNTASWMFAENIGDYKCIDCGVYPEEKPDYYYFLFRSNLQENNIHTIKISTTKCKDLLEAFPLAKEQVSKELLKRYSKQREKYWDTAKNIPYFTPSDSYTSDLTAGSFYIDYDSLGTYSGYLDLTGQYDMSFTSKNSKISLGLKKDEVYINDKIVTDPKEIGKAVLNLAKNI